MMLISGISVCLDIHICHHDQYTQRHLTSILWNGIFQWTRNIIVSQTNHLIILSPATQQWMLMSSALASGGVLYFTDVSDAPPAPVAELDVDFAIHEED